MLFGTRAWKAFLAAAPTEGYRLNADGSPPTFEGNELRVLTPNELGKVYRREAMTANHFLVMGKAEYEART